MFGVGLHIKSIGIMKSAIPLQLYPIAFKSSYALILRTCARAKPAGGNGVARWPVLAPCVSPAPKHSGGASALFVFGVVTK